MNNFRDIGYPPLAKGKLFRGCEFSDLSNEDRDFCFQACNIKTVIDLRSAEEVKDKKDAEVPGVQIINIPLLEIEEMSETVQGQFPNVLAAYRHAVNPKKKPLWSKIFEVLRNNEDGAILFHCTQGKDRTGIVVAIVLLALGVDKEIVLQDYLKTNENLSVLAEYLPYMETMPEDIRKLFQGLFLVDGDFLAEAFSEIEKQYGSLNRFYSECCSLDENKLTTLKTKYLRKE